MFLYCKMIFKYATNVFINAFPNEFAGTNLVWLVVTGFSFRRFYKMCASKSFNQGLQSNSYSCDLYCLFKSCKNAMLCVTDEKLFSIMYLGGHLGNQTVCHC